VSEVVTQRGGSQGVALAETIEGKRLDIQTLEHDDESANIPKGLQQIGITTSRGLQRTEE
jgi:hypothetical protein